MSGTQGGPRFVDDRHRYRLESRIATGGMGEVWRATDTSLGREVAVKVLKLNYQDRPDELAQLEREFHEAQSLSHPNVVSVFDLDRDGNVYFIVMELLEGELLADILKRLDGQPMERHYALGIISSVGVFGGFQGILIDPRTGVLMGGSDPRKDGAAMGY